MMQCGCGSTETGMILTYLDLPHIHTFHQTTFLRVQNDICPAIVELSEQSMDLAMQELDRKKMEPSYVPLTASYDMGWNKRSSGTKNNSISGHGLFLIPRQKRFYNLRFFPRSVINVHWYLKKLR